MSILFLLLLAVCCGLPVVYAFGRIIFTAYFNSKLDYEKRTHHGT